MVEFRALRYKDEDRWVVVFPDDILNVDATFDSFEETEPAVRTYLKEKYPHMYSPQVSWIGEDHE